MGHRAYEQGLDPELLQHIRECPCPCDHMGYGNFLDYQIPPCPRNIQQPSQSRETIFIAPRTPQTQHHRNYYNPEHHIHFTSTPPDRHYQGVIRYYRNPDTQSEQFNYQPYEYDSCSCSTESDSDRSNNLRGRWCVCLVVCVMVATVTAGLGLPLALEPLEPNQTSSFEDRLRIVKKLLKDSPLIDGHNDLAWNLRKFLHNQLNSLNLSEIKDKDPWSSSKWSHTDLPRLRNGSVGAQFWSAYAPCKAPHWDALQITLEQIDAIQRLVKREQFYMSMVRSAAEIRNVHQAGKIASLIGIEGGHALCNSLAVLRTFYNLGARYLTITHSCDTAWATGQDTITKNGLSNFGRTVVREMNRLGMIIDLSHSSVYTAKSAINASMAPVIFSHSAAYALCNSTRNVPDDVLRLIAQNGGIVMVNFYAYHVACSINATMNDVIKHINHIRQVVGVEHVGIGAGYDGINVTASGLEDVSRYPYLFAELLADPLWTENDIILLAGVNFLRVFEKVEQIRDQWKRAGILPFEELGPKSTMSGNSSTEHCNSENS